MLRARARARPAVPRRDGAASRTGPGVELERAVDKRLRGAERRRRVEQLVQLGGVEAGALVGQERVAEALAVAGFAAASRTIAWASARPSRSSSRNATRSASTSPPRRSRFARIRSGCTSSASSVSAIAASAPPVWASAPESASHSACQAPAARSCSWSSASVSTDACAAASRAEARASAAPTGFRFWGIVEDAPAPAEISPTSVCARSRTSSAIFAAAPAATASAPPRAAMRARFVCQGRAGTARSSSSAYSSSTRMPSSPKPESVPAAPPSWAARRSSAISASSARASATPISQPAALRPNVVGTACWSRVRAAIGVDRCSRARAAHAATTRSASSSTSWSALRATSIAAVSRMSWLVAPRCTWRETSSPTDAASARTSGSTGFPAVRPSSSSCEKSKRAGSHAASISAAAAAGTSPAAAAARASARSDASIPSSHARPETAARRPAGTNSASNAAMPRS